MNKNKNSVFWLFATILFILTILRFSGRLFSLSTYKEVFIVLLIGFLLIGALLILYRHLSNKQ